MSIIRKANTLLCLPSLTKAFVLPSHKVRNANLLLSPLQRTSPRLSVSLMSTFDDMASPEPNLNDDDATGRIKDLLSIIQGETSQNGLPQGRNFISRFDRQEYTVIKLPIHDEQDWGRLIEAGLTWDQFHKFCIPASFSCSRCVQVGPLYLSNTYLNTDTVEPVLTLGGYRDRLQIAMVQSGKEEGETYTSDQHGVMFRGLLNMYTSTHTGELKCHLENYAFNTPTMWAFAFDWGVVLDCLSCAYYRHDAIVGPYFAKWAAKNCRELIWWSNPITNELCWPLFLVDAESKIESLRGLDIKGYQVERFSAILQQSSKVKELVLYLPESTPSQTARLVQILCRCSHLEKVSLKSPWLQKMPAEDWMDLVISLIRCGHLKDILWLVQFDLVELDEMSTEELEQLKDARTQMILDAIKENPHLMKFELCSSYWRVVDVKKIHLMMEIRQKG